ncbi:MAG: FIG00387823: hypothetical protein [uncultured Sulfurovum sp.]|uniref:Uncharacterized protein n=1 Tax=uncultured Sulfurovum sp. TaxID=269237 RepID=A0A6S6SUD5_9BACT|nr:MAG: FIG00387823: hypothetical protein [uncultured Sulfurovum sp.]
MQKLLALLAILIIAITLNLYLKKVSTQYAFYHWKQSYTNSENTEPKYIKVMDIAYENEVKIHFTQFINKAKKKIVPVIYIDNPVFKHENAEAFAKKIFTLLKQKSKNSFNYNEVQIDCDWTESTKKPYFSFLKTFKKLSQITLSTTIRLHQIKYHKRTGVPPVDKGVLMYYNMSDFKDLETKNYILDLELAKKYHYNFDSYLLKLDLALPLYAQANIIRLGEVVRIIEGIRKKDLNMYFHALKNNHYEITKTHYFHKRLLYKGDVLRIDEVSIEDLQQAINNLKTVMKQPEEIIFYRWGNRGFYGEEHLKEVAKW